jgi:hypothetical protein
MLQKVACRISVKDVLAHEIGCPLMEESSGCSEHDN